MDVIVEQEHTHCGTKYLLFDSAEEGKTSHAREGNNSDTHTHSHAKANTDICTALNLKTRLVCHRIVSNTRSLRLFP